MATTKTTPHIQISQLELPLKQNLSEIEHFLSQGQVLFIQTGKYFAHYQDDVLKLKDTMDQLKKICIRRGGSMGRVGENILIITPHKNFKLG